MNVFVSITGKQCQIETEVIVEEAHVVLVFWFLDEVLRLANVVERLVMFQVVFVLTVRIQWIDRGWGEVYGQVIDRVRMRSLTLRAWSPCR